MLILTDKICSSLNFIFWAIFLFCLGYNRRNNFFHFLTQKAIIYVLRLVEKIVQICRKFARKFAKSKLKLKIFIKICIRMTVTVMPETNIQKITPRKLCTSSHDKKKLDFLRKVKFRSKIGIWVKSFHWKLEVLVKNPNFS